MESKVVDMRGNPRRSTELPVTDFWFAHVDLRLSRIERMINRLEWNVWLIVSGVAALLLWEIVQVIKPG